MMDNFAIFILSHGRPNKIYTINALIRAGYTGDYYIVVDNEDKTIDEYKAKYGDKVIVFDKAAIARQFDDGDNSQDRRSPIYARNACFSIAEQLGIRYFMELDDDYRNIVFKLVYQGVLAQSGVKDFDIIVCKMVEYFASIHAVSIALSQGGDFLGGRDNDIWYSVKRRKCMNSFLCDVSRRFTFTDKLNDDVNTYVHIGSIGGLFITIPFVCIHQKETQQSSGGLTEIYLDSGTYVKSFYTVMYHPSGTSISLMGKNHMRLHHKVSWRNTVPCILDEKYSKSVSK